MLTPRHFKIAVVLTALLSAGLTMAAWASSQGFTVTTQPTPGATTTATPVPIDPSTTQRIEVLEANGDVNVNAGESLKIGDTITTRNGTCRIVFDGTTELDVQPNTTLKITEALRNPRDRTSTTLLTIDSGRLKAKLAKLKDGSSFQIQSPTAIASVRGTTLYLNVNGMIFSQLFVDESKGGVMFENTKTGDSFLVPNFSLSTSFGDGTLENPRQLLPEEKEAFLKAWESYQQGNAQFELEGAGDEGTDDSDDESNADDSDDAKQDKKNEQNIAGVNGIEDDEEGSGDGDQAINAQEQAMIRAEIARIRNDQDFDRADANLAQISDAQTGKVFTDVHGNRVRTDQYIFHEANSNTVQFLSLTARTGNYQSGVSGIHYGVQFNQGISGETDLSSLPWSDYLNVVTHEEVAANLGIPEFIQGENGPEPNPDYEALAEQYIVHETMPELAGGETPFYPVASWVEFTNPDAGRGGRDLIRFEEAYSQPYVMELEGGDGLEEFTVQNREADMLTIDPLVGDKIERLVVNNGPDMISINDGEFELMGGNEDHGGDGTQTTSFAKNFVAGNFADINFYKNMPVNEDGNPDNDDHPAYFQNGFNDRFDGDALIGRNELIGVFIPFNDAGQIIDQPGFTIEGIGDLLSPNSLVNGGNYNLEIIFYYGYRDENQDDQFHEEFRIDTIITPEIFGGFGAPGPNPQLFPASLYDDDDDHPQQPY